MEKDNDAVQERPHFGEYLRESRLQKGLTVEMVCRETRLSRHMVESIEAGDRSALPEDVLLKSFLRLVAEACGADGETAVSLYLEAYPPPRGRTPFYGSGNRRRNLGLLCCLIALVSGAIFFFNVD